MMVTTKQIKDLSNYVQSVVSNTSSAVWGAFYSNSTQTNASTSSTNAVTFNGADADNNGVSVVSNSRITVASAGVYNVQFSAQIDKTDSNDDPIEIWLSKNGNDVPSTNTKVTVTGNNAKYVAAWNFVLKLSANDYVELKWYSADINMRLVYEGSASNPARPSIPSVILTVTRAI